MVEGIYKCLIYPYVQGNYYTKEMTMAYTDALYEAEYEVGQEVGFKADIEGSGVVLAVVNNPYGSPSYIIGNGATRPGYEHWHTACYDNHRFGQAVVSVDECSVWEY